MKHIGIIPNRLKDTDLKVTERIATWFNKNNLSAYTTPDIAEHIQAHTIAVSEKELYEICDSLIVIGGDGTILSVAEAASIKDIPIVGVNLGRLGFLADIEPQEIEVSLQKLLEGVYEIEERMMLKATIISPEDEKYVFHALNDINVTRGSFARLVEFEIRINNELCDIYPADGMIVSSPTGSTAYNLSAGGPILVPHANTYVVTPICPHTLYAKSIILSDHDTIQIATLEEAKDMALSIDGRLKMYLTPQHVVHIERATQVTKLIKLSERKFFDILREKIVERRR
ncbi:NAD(+)/NADH kinase [Cellulosilyticum sp. ST5]|uniref:NAD(+)/NADH kinase n=1 Tax=unclassified Cellulosilyticum TaxID=2643091 RepID=UPI001681B174|nr:NAD(+)/NADH kinase [Cellulosilyticum sp. WCF-2]